MGESLIKVHLIKDDICHNTDEKFICSYLKSDASTDVSPK